MSGGSVTVGSQIVVGGGTSSGDTHWNSAGNLLAADILFDELAKRVELKKP